MKKTYLYMLAIAAALFSIAAINRTAKTGFTTGTPEIKSISSLAFGPDGILFVGDSKSATVFAVYTKDTKKNKKPSQ